MAVKSPRVGQLAFRGNSLRALKKFSESVSSMLLFMNQHPQWPVKMFNAAQITQLQSLQSVANVNTVIKVPPPP